MNCKEIKERYSNNYIRDDQLERFKKLGIITEAQYKEIYALKHQVDTETTDNTEANV